MEWNVFFWVPLKYSFNKTDTTVFPLEPMPFYIFPLLRIIKTDHILVPTKK